MMMMFVAKNWLIASESNRSNFLSQFHLTYIVFDRVLIYEFHLKKVA